MTEPLLTDEDMATRYGRSRWFIQERCRGESSWPHLRVGRQIRFLPAHVDAIDKMLEAGSTKPAAPVNPWGHKGRSA